MPIKGSHVRSEDPEHTRGTTGVCKTWTASVFLPLQVSAPEPKLTCFAIAA